MCIANDVTARSKDELEKGLEDQYNQGLELRLSGAVRRHTGLGFHEEPVKKPEIEANVTGVYHLSFDNIETNKLI